MVLPECVTLLFGDLELTTCEDTGVLLDTDIEHGLKLFPHVGQNQRDVTQFQPNKQ